MQVKLLDPLDASVSLRRTWVALRTCQSRLTPYQLWQESENQSTEKMLKLVSECYKSNHYSVFRHAEFMFAISGISRSCSLQLVRHHVGFSPEQQSQRSVGLEHFGVVIPPSIEVSPEDTFDFNKAVGESRATAIGLMAGSGVPKEDARYLAPEGTTTNLVVTANLNSLILVARERLCSLAQWEIRRVIATMRAELGRAHPWTREMLVISCMAQGYCSQYGNKDGHCTVRPVATAAQVTEALRHPNVQ